MSTTTLPLQPGQRPPAIALPSTSSQTIDLDHYRDKVRVAVVFLGRREGAGGVTAALDAALVEFGSRRVQLLVVAVGPLATARALLPDAGTVPILSDGDGSVTESYGAMGGDHDVHAVLIEETGVISDVLVIDHEDPVPRLLEALDSAMSSPPENRVDNSPRVVDERNGEEVDVEQWDPMPDTLRALDGVDESSLPGHPMDGDAPTG